MIFVLISIDNWKFILFRSRFFTFYETLVRNRERMKDECSISNLCVVNVDPFTINLKYVSTYSIWFNFIVILLICERWTVWWWPFERCLMKTYATTFTYLFLNKMISLKRSSRNLYFYMHGFYLWSVYYTNLCPTLNMKILFSPIFKDERWNLLVQRPFIYVLK